MILRDTKLELHPASTSSSKVPTVGLYFKILRTYQGSQSPNWSHHLLFLRDSGLFKVSLFTAAMIAGLRRPAKSGRVMRTQKCVFLGGSYGHMLASHLRYLSLVVFCRKKPKKHGAQTFCGYPGFFLEKKVKGARCFPQTDQLENF